MIPDIRVTVWLSAAFIFIPRFPKERNRTGFKPYAPQFPQQARSCQGYSGGTGPAAGRGNVHPIQGASDSVLRQIVLRYSLNTLRAPFRNAPFTPRRMRRPDPHHRTSTLFPLLLWRTATPYPPHSPAPDPNRHPCNGGRRTCRDQTRCPAAPSPPQAKPDPVVSRPIGMTTTPSSAADLFVRSSLPGGAGGLLLNTAPQRTRHSFL